MNSATIEESIHKVFPIMRRLDSNNAIIRCERRPNDILMSVFYFEVSDLHFDDPFDLDSFLESHIANDFYRHRGLVQWNYYLVFVVNDSRIAELKRNGRIAAIESNRAYARKFVVAESELGDFLRGAVSVVAAPAQGNSDFAARWRERLDRGGLSEICSATPRVQLLRKYRAGQFEPPAATQATAVARQDFKLSRLKSLTINRYRGRIRPDTYDLCQVNLLHGPNGAGKTSFMEAIELCICGQTSQNGPEPGEASLALALDGGHVEHFPGKPGEKDDAFFRTRDRLLYGRAYPRGNHLSSAFSRYNFFATDAAFRLAHQDTATAISKALTDFIVGPDTATLDDRLKKMGEALEGEVKGLSSAIGRMEAELRSMEGEVERLSKTFVEPAQEVKLVGDVLSSLPIAQTQREKLHSGADLRAFLAGVMPVVDSIVGNVDWVRPLTLDAIERERIELTALQKTTEEATNAIEGLRHKKRLVETNVASRQESVKSLRRLHSYLAIASPAEIRGMSARLGTLEALSRVGAVLAPSIEKCRTIESAFPNAKFSTVMTELERQERESAKALKDVNAELGRASDTATKLRAHLEALREHGLEILNAGGNEAKCPLCSASHAPGELRSAIESIETQLASSSKVSTLMTDRRRLEGERAKAIEALTVLRQQAELYSTLSQGKLQPASSQTFAAIRATFERLEQDQVAISDELRRLTETKEALTRLGFSEVDFAKVAASLPQSLQDSTSLTKELVEEAAAKILGEVGTESQTAAGLQEEIASLEKERDTRLQGKVPGLQEFAYIAKLLPERISKLEAARQRAATLNGLFQLQAGADLVTLASLLKVEFKRVDEFILLGIRARESSDSLSKAKAEVERLRNELPTKRAEHSNLKRPLDIVSDILLHDSIEGNLRTFLQAYKDTISDIFASIHAPREFSAIVLGEGGVEDILLVREGGERVNLKQISTGQRSALALSIFLALHSSIRSRADLILIDDPVAHVDDLNSLSFLDHLRNLALDGAQIVFATADQKLARLFEMKFSFLAEVGAYQQLQFAVDGTIAKKEVLVPKEQQKDQPLH